MIWFESGLALLAVGWGVYQLLDLRRERRRDAAKAAAADSNRST